MKQVYLPRDIKARYMIIITFCGELMPQQLVYNSCPYSELSHPNCDISSKLLLWERGLQGFLPAAESSTKNKQRNAKIELQMFILYCPQREEVRKIL